MGLLSRPQSGFSALVFSSRAAETIIFLKKLPSASTNPVNQLLLDNPDMSNLLFTIAIPYFLFMNSINLL
jgi:hypothetical protein